MNLDYLIKKKCLFKKRSFSNIVFTKKIIFGDSAFYTPSKIYFELIYFRYLKILFKRKYIRKKIKIFKPKYWLFIRPNFILSKKSKNSRMGAGVGSLLRICSIIYPGKAIICLKGFHFKFLLRLKSIFYRRYPFTFNFIGLKNML